VIELTGRVRPARALLRNAEQVISYDVIRERVWGYGEAPASNALQVFVGFLRRKLFEAQPTAQLIEVYWRTTSSGCRNSRSREDEIG